MEFFQFEIIINVLDSSFRFILIPMLWAYGHSKYFLLLQYGDRLSASDREVLC